MSDTNDGGPAFPIPITGCADGCVYDTLEKCAGSNGGMTLRDYHAAHSHQPGTVEAYQLAGHPEVPKPLGWPNFEWEKNITARASIWWDTLTLSEKYCLYAQLRYLAADAMLAERNRRSGGA